MQLLVRVRVVLNDSSSSKPSITCGQRAGRAWQGSDLGDQFDDQGEGVAPPWDSGPATRVYVSGLVDATPGCRYLLTKRGGHSGSAIQPVPPGAGDNAQGGCALQG
jgi:hypothetical protein